MALASTGVFEVQGGVGSDSNAGYYDPAISGAGTDLTYPTSSPVTISDLVIHASTTTKVKSASLVALSAVPNGNSMIISSGTGFTASAIPYVVTGNDGTYWILDRAAGTASSTGGSAIAGGALSSLTPFATSGFGVAGNTIWMKGNGSYYDVGGGATIAIASGAQTNAAPYTSLRGYGTTRKDRVKTAIRLTSGSFTSALTVNNIALYDLLLQGGGSYSTLIGSAGCIIASRCSFTTSYYLCHTAFGATAIFRDCEITGNYELFNGNSGYIFGLVLDSCNIHDNPLVTWFKTIDTNANTPRMIYTGNLFTNNSGVAVQTSLNCLVDGNTFYATKFQIVNDTGNDPVNSGPNIRNNHFENSPGYGMDASASMPLWADGWNGNSYYNNTSGARSSNVGSTSGDTDDIILTSSAFVNASGGDFRLNNNAGGGAELRGKGYPLSWPGLSGVANARDMGAYQHATPPLGLTVDNSGAHPVLTWDADPLATNYYVKVYNDSGGSTPPTTGTTYTIIAVIAAGTTTYTHTAAASGTNYYEVSSSH